MPVRGCCGLIKFVRFRVFFGEHGLNGKITQLYMTCISICKLYDWCVNLCNFIYMHMAEERKIIFLHSSSLALLHECYTV